ncbi:MAG: hypothetical protein JSV89_03245, partial [Spirochaetaceae bacterium]
LLLCGLLFAEADDHGSGPVGTPAGYMNMYWYGWMLQAQAKLATQNQLMGQARHGGQANESAALDAGEAPVRLQERSGDCTSDCDGEPDQDQAQKQLRDGSGDGIPDKEQTRTGRSG